MNDLATGFISMELPQRAKFIRERTIHITSGALDPDATPIKPDDVAQPPEEHNTTACPQSNRTTVLPLPPTEPKRTARLSHQNTRFQK